jgi:choline dehydrogenase
MNRRGETRISTLLSHLRHVRGRANLTILANRLVDRLLFDGDRASGVQLADGSIQQAETVVLCSGSIGTPAILLRSGIGPAHQLEALGIRPRIDLPGVGARLWDHAAVPIRLVPHADECVIGRDPRFQIMARFTAAGSAQSDDMQLVMTTHLDLRSSPALMAEAEAPVVAALRIALMQPVGHGTLALRSADPAEQPVINLNYCAHSADMRRLMEGVRLAWAVLQTDPLAKAYERIAGLSAETVGSDERLASYIRGNVGTYCHASGTVPIGPDHDGGAALDQRCVVRGTANLYVADASIFPRIPGAVPNMTVMMVAERVADWLTS